MYSTCICLSPNVKSEQNYKEKCMFSALLLCKFALITHNAPYRVKGSIEFFYSEYYKHVTYVNHRM